MLVKSITDAIEIKILQATTWWILNVSNLFKHLTVRLTMHIMIIWSVAFTASAMVAFIVTLKLF